MSGAITKKIKKDEYLFREGNDATSLFIISEGTLSIRKRKGSDFVEIAKVFSNEVLGEISFFDRSNPRNASAIALTDCTVLELFFTDLDKIFDKVPSYLRTIMASIAERLRKADDLIRVLQKEVILGEGSVEGTEKPEPEPAAPKPAATSAGNATHAPPDGKKPKG
jgi:CRP-like cAMP-binding protein